MKYVAISYMDILPIDLQKIIHNYKEAIEVSEKYNECMKELMSIKRRATYIYNRHNYNNSGFYVPINTINGVLFVNEEIMMTEYTNRVKIAKYAFYI